MSLILTSDELEELTDDSTPSGQRAWLTARGWIFETGKRGRPKVLRSYAEAKLGGAGRPQEFKPDFSDLPAG